MAKIIVAFGDKEQARKLAAVLSQAGYPVFRTCATGNEVMRAFNQCQDGLLVCAARLPDRTVDTLAEDLEAKALILAVGKPEQLELCESPHIFRLRLPATKGELTASVEMLVQLHYKRLPHRPAAQNAEIAQAKRLLMAHGMSEQEAHRFLQQASMRLGVKMAQAAARVLAGTLTCQ